MRIITFILLCAAIEGIAADPRDSVRDIPIAEKLLYDGVTFSIGTCKFSVQKNGIAAISSDGNKIAVSIGRINRPENCTLPYGVYLVDLIKNKAFLIYDTAEDPLNNSIDWQPGGDIFMVDSGSSPLRAKTIFESKSHKYLGQIITLGDQYVWGNGVLLYTSYARIKNPCAFRGFGEAFGIYRAKLPGLEIETLLEPNDWIEYEIVNADADEIDVSSVEIERIENCTSPKLKAAWRESIYLSRNGSIIRRQSPEQLLGLVEANVLYIRSEPSIRSPITGHLRLAEEVRVKERSQQMDTINGITTYWYNISTSDGRRGWSFGHYIRLIPKL